MVDNEKIRVCVNGYGVIGKRVADAVVVQDDMELAGVSDVVSDYRIRVAAELGYPIFASVPDKASVMEEANIPVEGSLEELLGTVDVVVDCTPKGIGQKNKELYEKTGVKAIFQGGEEHDLAGLSFTAQVNYEEALNKDFARVVSCNTTALCRVINALQQQDWVKKARAVLMRRATDPWESHEDGMINTAIPETKVPSHQGPDAQTVLKDLDIVTMAGAGPFNLSHLHYLMVETNNSVSLDELRHALWLEPRISFIHANDGIVALNSTVELMRDLGRIRNDMWEVAVWEDALAASDNELYMAFQVDNEAIAIPENIDCIRSLTGVEEDGKKSIEMTNEALGIVKSYLPVTIPETEIHEHLASKIEEEKFKEEGYKGAEEPHEGPPSEEEKKAG